MMLHCNIISYWLGAYTKWSLILTYPDSLNSYFVINWWGLDQCFICYKWFWIFKYYLLNSLSPDGWDISCEIATIKWMALNLPDKSSTLVQVMAWCHQATNHYLSLCWPWSMFWYDITRPQWVTHSTLCILLLGETNPFPSAHDTSLATQHQWCKIDSIYVCAQPMRDVVTL